MVILLGSAQQAKAQDQEEDEDWSSLVQLVVLTVFAMIGLSAVIRWLVMLVIPEGRSLEKKEDEEKLEKRVKEALSAASGQRGASRAQESGHGKATLAQKRQSEDEEAEHSLTAMKWLFQHSLTPMK